MTAPSTAWRSDRLVYPLDAPPAGSAAERVALLGGKGANLAVMAGDLGLPVPPGFVVTTAACHQVLAGRWPEGLEAELHDAMDALGARLGRRFGDPHRPLLVSVRSGAPVSMPGMMDTILDLGLNEATAAGLARRGGAEFAADCWRRFRTGYASVIGSQAIPDDPWQQLRLAVEAVFRSWSSDRARSYRAREGIAEHLGTAVTVQAMVFGNSGEHSGTGVLFTRNPSTGEAEPYGDILFDAQGEDVVAGTHAPQPISALEVRLPEAAAELRASARRLERHYRDLCDIEFTIEDGRLWLLQVRVGKRSPRAALRMAAEMATEADFPLERVEAIERVRAQLSDPPRVFVRAGRPNEPLAIGLPASPGVARGIVVTSSDEALARAGKGQALILVRDETSPEDVRGMSAAAGVLTARGGLASHAAVVARGWGLPAVVGAGARVLELAGGDLISIDGSSGEVFGGELRGEWQVAPEVTLLLDWARQLGVELTHAPEGGGPDVADRPTDQAVDHGADEVLRAIAIKGSVGPEQLADAVMTAPETIAVRVAALTAAGLVEVAAGSVRPTATGRLRVAQLFATDRADLGPDRAVAQLDRFQALDGRLKDIVTAWQLREVAGEQTVNDHADAAYDAGVRGRLADLHEETAAWLAPLNEAFPRFGLYARRLDRALDRAADDGRYVASPRVDSYHTVWFELHEDLLRLADRSRADEAGPPSTVDRTGGLPWR